MTLASDSQPRLSPWELSVAPPVDRWDDWVELDPAAWPQRVERHVIFVESGSSEATQAARDLFASTMVEQVVTSLDDHDRLIAYVLGLSHALNIAFFTALAESGEAAPRLAKLSSTTFDSQLDVASKVAQESPELYFEIQSLNDYGSESLEALAQAVERLRSAVISQDFTAFEALMRRGREYLEDRRSVTERRA